MTSRSPSRHALVRGLAFDLDGVLIDSDPLWERCRVAVLASEGRRWDRAFYPLLMGLSPRASAEALKERFGLRAAASEIEEKTDAFMIEALQAERDEDGRVARLIARLARSYRIAIASSCSRPVIEAAAASLGIASYLDAIVSSEEVGVGKPAPAVFLAAAVRLELNPSIVVAVEDSDAGIRSALAAGMRVVALPNKRYPPAADLLGKVDAAISSLDEVEELLANDSWPRPS